MSNGVFLSVLASALFGVLYYFSTLLVPLDGEEVFGWRLLLTFPGVTAYLLYMKDWEAIAAIGRRVRRQPWLAAALVASSALVGIQLWLFMWAPLHGRGLQVSLGYFLLPLVMILAGRVIYREQLSRPRQIATACAALGVANQIYQLGGFSWETLVVAFGYPLYFVMRRQLNTANLGGFWFDMALLSPVALWFVLKGEQGGLAGLLAHPALLGLVPVMGLISTFALIFYMRSSRLLPLSLFGLLSYVEPVLLMLVALMLGETIARAEWFSYIAIWMAVGMLVFEGGWRLFGPRRNRLAGAADGGHDGT